MALHQAPFKRLSIVITLNHDGFTLSSYQKLLNISLFYVDLYKVDGHLGPRPVFL